MNCTHCGSSIMIGGPPCCDGGAAKRKAAADRWDAITGRLGRIESALKTLYSMHACTAGEHRECAICEMHSELTHG